MQASSAPNLAGTGPNSRESVGPAADESIIHRLDARTKMGISLAASIAVIFFAEAESLGLLLAASTAYALALRRYKVVILCYLLLGVMWCFAFGFMHGMHALWDKIPTAEPAKLLVPFLRSAVMANVVMALALSSRVQSLLTALKSLHLPFCIYIPSAVMIRFIPSFITDVKQIAETMRTRGHQPTPWMLMSHPVMTMRLVFTPILFRALRTSDELAIAAELKGLGTRRTITPYKTQRLSRIDGVATVLTVLLLVGGCVLHVMFKSETGAMFS